MIDAFNRGSGCRGIWQEPNLTIHKGHCRSRAGFLSCCAPGTSCPVQGYFTLAELCELRSSAGSRAEPEPWGGGGQPRASRCFGQAGLCRGCSAQPLSVPFWFFTTALRCKQSGTHTECERVWWVLACFCIYMLMCEPARERGFFSYISWREPPLPCIDQFGNSPHRLHSAHIPLHACSLAHLCAHVCAHAYMHVFTLHHLAAADRALGIRCVALAMQMSV